MYPQRQGRGAIPGKECSPVPKVIEEVNGCPKAWLKELEERKRNRMRGDSVVHAAWSRENSTGNYSSETIIPPTDTGSVNGYPSMNVMTSLNKTNNSLWNRRRTNSTNSVHSPNKDNTQHPNNLTNDSHSAPINQHVSSGSPSSVLPVLQQRGSSASPRVSHTSGFWVQDPEDVHQMWVGTDYAEEDISENMDTSSPRVWTAANSSGNRFPLQPTSPQRAPQLVNKVSHLPPSTGCTSNGTPNKNFRNQLSLISGGASDGEGSGEVSDLQTRMKRFQQKDSQKQHQHSQQLNSGSVVARTATSSSSQVVRSQQQQKQVSSISSHSSSTNVAESTSKSSTNLSELKSSLSNVKSNINEMTAQQSNSFSRSLSKSSSSTVQQQSCSSTSSGSSFGKISSSGFKSVGSLDNLPIRTDEELYLPDVTEELKDLEVVPTDGTVVSPMSSTVSSPHSSQKEMKFEEKKVHSSSKTKVVKDNDSYESASGHSSESRKLKSGDVSYEESSRIAASKSKLEKDGVTAEKAAALQEEARHLRAGDLTLREGSQKKGAAMKMSGEGFSAHKAALSESQQRSAVTSAGSISQESSRKSSKSGLTITAKGVCTKQSAESMSCENNVSMSGFDNPEFNNTIMEFSGTLSNFVDQLKGARTSGETFDPPSLLNSINTMIKKAWTFPVYGHELGSSLCNVLRHSGGLDILLENCKSVDENLKLSSAKVIEQCLTTENRGYVVDKDLKSVVEVACDCAQKPDYDQSRVGMGILEHLFKHNEGTCSNIIKMGGLEAVLNKCKKSDKLTLQHCAGALANLSLYGGEENQRLMMKRKAHLWLFPLAFHEDDNIKYYACLAIAALVANKEIEASVIESGTLRLLEPFVNSHIPEEFSMSNQAHFNGQSKSWLKRLVHVLTSKREEAKSLAAFHFCMEAGVKKKQGNLDIFYEIGAIAPLKEVASSPNAIASRYAIQALSLMGEEVPHKLSQQVPLWSMEDTKEWVKQIGFEVFADDFAESKVDGDLLLRMTDQNLKEDIGISNGILRQRFMRELSKLKQMADYSYCDNTKIYEFLFQLGPEFTQYTYALIQAGVTRDYLRYLKEEQLSEECKIQNAIHRQKISNAIITEDQNNLAKDLDIFISYRRSNGSQLASLLKVHLTLRGFSVFIDVERLEAGKFDNNLLNSIQQAKTFILVLTNNALERCMGDDECKDWVHKEIVAALRSECTIIPIIDNFHWPEPEHLPEDMRLICKFNGIRWIHDYQEACVDKLERFMRGEGMTRDALSKYAYGSSSFLGGGVTPGTPSTLPRTLPGYYRTPSMESGKGSSCSDKELSKD